MLRSQWNALPAGDRVLVHDDHDHHRPPHPRRSAVDLIEYGPRDTCWRCQALDEAMAA
jgi:hypothetical protein